MSLYQPSTPSASMFVLSGSAAGLQGRCHRPCEFPSSVFVLFVCLYCLLFILFILFIACIVYCLYYPAARHACKVNINVCEFPSSTAPVAKKSAACVIVPVEPVGTGKATAN